MGFLGKLFNAKADIPKGIAVQNVPFTVCAPFSGRAMKLADIPDPVFSQGALGPGCGIEPAEESVYAPFDGTVNMIAETKHAIGLTSVDGMEVLIHVGMDTVDMEGKGFSCLAKEGQSVQAGQPLLTFSLADIEAAGHTPITAIVLTNGDEFGKIELLTEGNLQHGVPLLKINK